MPKYHQTVFINHQTLPLKSTNTPPSTPIRQQAFNKHHLLLLKYKIQPLQTPPPHQTETVNHQHLPHQLRSTNPLQRPKYCLHHIKSHQLTSLQHHRHLELSRNSNFPPKPIFQTPLFSTKLRKTHHSIKDLPGLMMIKMQ